MTSPLQDFNSYREFYIQVSTNFITHQELECFVGETVKIKFNCYNQNDEAIDLSGASATYYLSRSDYSQVVSKTVGSGISLSGEVATITIDSDDIDTSGKYIGQLHLQKDGNIVVLASGNVRFNKVIE